MPITTETVDSSGEILHLKGLDISDFLDGNAWANWEHSNDLAENIVGKFVYAKKIFEESDCENERQREYWDKMKTPFLYGVCELMDQEFHPGAVAVAAMIRYFKNRKEPIKVGASIEGQTLERKDGDLMRTVGRRVAITLRPCNKQCWVDFMGDGEDSDKFLKSTFDGQLVGHEVEIDSNILEDEFPSDAVGQLKKALGDLNKTLTAGSYAGCAPEGMTGGAALAVEDRGLRNRARAAYRDWDRRRPLREVMKAALPEVSESYVDHLVSLAHDLYLKKGMDPNLVRIGPQHAMHQLDNDQSKLLEGLYWDPSKTYHPGHHEFHNPIYKLRNDSGDDAFVKEDQFANADKAPHKGPAYYRMAKDFFDMGDHVPVTAAIAHEKISGGKPMQVQQFLKDARSPLDSSADWAKAMQAGRESGSLHKLAMMDMIMGNADRHIGNVMVHDGRVYHVDNDLSFSNEVGGYPFYVKPHGRHEGIGSDAPHIDASQWLRSLSPRKLLLMSSAHGIMRGEAAGMVGRLRALQEMDRQGHTIGQMAEKIQANRFA